MQRAILGVVFMLSFQIVQAYADNFTVLTSARTQLKHRIRLSYLFSNIWRLRGGKRLKGSEKKCGIVVFICPRYKNFDMTVRRRSGGRGFGGPVCRADKSERFRKAWDLTQKLGDDKISKKKKLLLQLQLDTLKKRQRQHRESYQKSRKRTRKDGQERRKVRKFKAYQAKKRAQGNGSPRER
eukprot:jgi/Bigna1/84694/fgenesh1_pg.219_\